MNARDIKITGAITGLASLGYLAYRWLTSEKASSQHTDSNEETIAIKGPVTAGLPH